MPAIRQIAFIVNTHKPGAIELSSKLMALAQKQGCAAKLTLEYPVPDGFLRGVEACCVLGGDGTLLSVVPQAVSERVPVFGINQGTLGFLASYTSEEAQTHLMGILAGHYQIDERPVLKVILPNGEHSWALNDVVLKHGQGTRLLPLQVSYNKEWVTDYFCDGIIFAAPTGSTAYNLSAGGPIILPSVRVIAMTPICPHTLSNRSVIFPEDAKLEIQCPQLEARPYLSLDGRAHAQDQTLFPLRVILAEETFLLLQPRHVSYFSVLRTKLKWGK